MDKYEKFWKVLSKREKDKIMQAYGDIASTPGNVIVTFSDAAYEGELADKETLFWVTNFFPNECTVKVLCKCLNKVKAEDLADPDDNVGYGFEADFADDNDSFCIVVSAKGKELGVIWFDFDDESDAKMLSSIVKWINSHLK